MAAPTKFLILSDTHNLERDASQEYPICQPMPKVDVVLHCGDLTREGGIASYKKALKLLGTFDAELKLVIAGNHDKSLDGAYWDSHLGRTDDPEEHDKAIELMTGPQANAANVTYLIEGLHTFTLKNGTTFNIFVSPFTPEFCDWAFPYKKGEDRWNIPLNADIAMTHGPPRGDLDSVGGKHLGCEQLAKAIAGVRPLLHCFGHIHEGHGASVKQWNGVNDNGNGDECQVTWTQAGSGVGGKARFVRGKKTLMINAAIMNESNKPENAPYVVELSLGKK
jgi:predicted phosphodiesterase